MDDRWLLEDEAPEYLGVSTETVLCFLAGTGPLTHQ